MNANAILAASAILAATIPAPSVQGADAAFKDAPGKHLDLVVDGRPVMRYMYEYDASTKESNLRTYKPYFHVFASDGETLITKAVEGQYTHHRGIFTGFSKLKHGGKSYDLWHMKNGAAQVHQEFPVKKDDSNALTLTTRVQWNLPDKTTALEEDRTVVVHKKTDGALLLADFKGTVTAANGDVELNGDPEHAGFQYRPHADVGKNKSAKYVFPAEDSNPKKDRDMDWVALTYELDGKKYTVQMMRDKGNPKNSIWSAYRDYGRFGNFFVETVPDKKSLSWNYRIRITEGDAPPRAEFQKQFDSWKRS